MVLAHAKKKSRNFACGSKTISQAISKGKHLMVSRFRVQVHHIRQSLSQGIPQGI
jgi:hypothetical protein